MRQLNQTKQIVVLTRLVTLLLLWAFALSIIVIWGVGLHAMDRF